MFQDRTLQRAKLPRGGRIVSAADLNGRESIVNFTPDPSRVKVTILERVAPFGFFPAFYLHSANNCSCVVEL